MSADSKPYDVVGQREPYIFEIQHPDTGKYLWATLKVDLEEGVLRIKETGEIRGSTGDG